MKIGIVGMGKLGTPVAIAIAEHGHKVIGYDVDQKKLVRYAAGTTGLYEPGINEQLQKVLKSKELTFSTDLRQVVDQSDIIFIAVQTPHDPQYDGTHAGMIAGVDFDYSILQRACVAVAHEVHAADSYKTIAIISTVLPGTTRSYLYPIMRAIVGREINDGWDLMYNPSFIAMGQTIKDYTNPEFTLIGMNDAERHMGNCPLPLEAFYSTIHYAEKLVMSWEEAEATKVFYNVMIGQKITFANMVMQVAHEMHFNSDEVLGALKKAKYRLISEKYLSGGMGDSGECHPRDALALSSLSKRLNLGYDMFSALMDVREQQARWIARLLVQHSNGSLPITILGKAYKAGTNLTGGSCSLLIGNILIEQGIQVQYIEPTEDGNDGAGYEFVKKSVFLLATPWEQFKKNTYSSGSVIIDPWGFLEAAPDGCALVRVGRAHE